MGETVTAYGGASVPVNSLALTIGYTGGFSTTLTYSYGIDYVQTITRDGSGNPLSISQLIPQEGRGYEEWLTDGLPKYIGQLNKALTKQNEQLKKANKPPTVFLNDITKIGVRE